MAPYGYTRVKPRNYEQMVSQLDWNYFLPALLNWPICSRYIIVFNAGLKVAQLFHKSFRQVPSWTAYHGTGTRTELTSFGFSF